MKSCWPGHTDWCPNKKAMRRRQAFADLENEEDHAEREGTPCNNERKNRSHRATSQGASRMAGNHQQLEEARKVSFPRTFRESTALMTP